MFNFCAMTNPKPISTTSFGDWRVAVYEPPGMESSFTPVLKQFRRSVILYRKKKSEPGMPCDATPRHRRCIVSQQMSLYAALPYAPRRDGAVDERDGDA